MYSNVRPQKLQKGAIQSTLMKIRAQRTLILTVGFLVLTLILYLLFLRSPYFQSFLQWSQQHIIFYSLTLFCLKVLAIVYAPLPGGLLSIASIPVLGWKLAYVIDLLGSMTGASIAFYLGKKYGLKFMARIFDESTLEKITKIKINKNREIEGVFVLRILTGSSILDALCYAAGLLNVGYKNFLIGSIFSHLLVGIPAFYLSKHIFTAQNLAMSAVVLVFTLGILYKLKGRYLE